MTLSGLRVRFRCVKKITLLFVVMKLAHILIIVLTPAQFDVSSSILLDTFRREKILLSTFHTSSVTLNTILNNTSLFFLDRFLDRLVTWDAVYFADLFTNGIKYEHQFVFCPLWWRLIKMIPVNANTGFYSRLIWATFITNLCHLLASIVLYFYTLTVFGKARIFSPLRMAMAALMLYVCSPAAAFLTAPYSESIASLCSFLCLFARELGVGQSQLVSASVSQLVPEKSVSGSVLGFTPETNPKHATLSWALSSISPPFCPSIVVYLSSGVFAALAFGFRANCLFLGLIYVYDLVYKKTRTRFLPLAAGLILGIAFVSAHIHSYVSVCHLGRGAWCESRIPSLFAYAQSHYWGNGFLKYWTPNNVPNFVFAAPTVLLLGFAIKYFAQIYPVERILPVLAANVVFLVLLMMFWHVQIVTRIHTFMPVVYWFVAGLFTQQSTLGVKWAKVWVGYFIVWNVLQVSLFSAFLPPA